MQANLRKAPKLTYEAIHPGNKKQNVQLALNIFHETATAAISSYFPDREDATEFIRLINTWWNISNSKYQFDSHYRIKNAVVLGDKKQILFEKQLIHLKAGKIYKSLYLKNSPSRNRLVLL